jgi:hypothetical protein
MALFIYCSNKWKRRKKEKERKKESLIFYMTGAQMMYQCNGRNS